MRRRSVLPDDGRHLNIPKARSSLGGIRRPAKPARATGNGGLNSGRSVDVALPLPKVRPGPTLEAALKVENLDAIAASRENSTKQIAIVDEDGAGGVELTLQRRDARGFCFGHGRM